MAEYDRIQKKQENRAVANNGGRNKQGKRIIDCRNNTLQTKIDPTVDIPDDGFAVYGRAILNGYEIANAKSGRFWGQTSEHAEEQIIDFIDMLECDWRVEGYEEIQQSIKENMERGVKNDLVILLSSSPCTTSHSPATRSDGESGCAQKLIELQNSGNYQITVIAKKYYAPTSVGTGAKSSSIAAYATMIGAGIQL